MRNSILLSMAMSLLLFGIPFLQAGAEETTAEHREETPSSTQSQETEPSEEEAQLPTGEKDSSVTITALLQGEIVELPLGEYLMGVVRAEMPASFELEALKAQAVAARTYTLYKIQNGGSANHPEADTCDDVSCCKAYLDKETAAENWGMNALIYEQKIEAAVKETDGQVVLYDSQPILAVFHSSSAGSTNNVEDVWQQSLPYLRSVASPETESAVPNYYSKVSFSLSQFKELVTGSYPDADLSGSPSDWFTNIQQTEDGLVKSLQVGGVTMTGGALRSLLGLRSASFTVAFSEDAVDFSVTGYGHGVGMSQYGANEMAKSGSTYQEILSWYYTGTTIGAFS